MIAIVAALDWFGRLLARPALAVRGRRAPQWLTVLLYHRVMPRPDGDFALDKDVVDATPESFDRHMAFLAARTTPIDLAQLLAFRRGEAALPRNPVLVTFDDGYLDNRQHALPILRRHGVRALFFVASSYVGQRRLFWWDRLAYLFHHAQVASGRLSYPTDMVLRLGDDRRRSLRTALRIVKTHRGLDLERFLAGLAEAFEVVWDADLDRRLTDENIMTWDDVRALREGGMDIGSHTRTHRVLDTVDPRALPDELVESKAEIERAIGAKVASLSYPVGRAVRRLPLIENAVRDAGYEIGFSVESKPNRLAATFDPFNVTRVPVNGSWTHHRLAAVVAAPELAGAV